MKVNSESISFVNANTKTQTITSTNRSFQFNFVSDGTKGYLFSSPYYSSPSIDVSVISSHNSHLRFYELTAEDQSFSNISFSAKYYLPDELEDNEEFFLFIEFSYFDPTSSDLPHTNEAIYVLKLTWNEIKANNYTVNFNDFDAIELKDNSKEIASNHNLLFSNFLFS